MKRSVAILGTRGYPSYYGGFETLVRYLAPELANQGWDVTVYGRDGSTKPDDPSLDTRVRAINTRGIETKSVSTLSYGLSSTLHAARKKPDVALIMNVANGYWLPILRKYNIPTVVNVDGIEWEREKWGRVAKAAFRAGAKLTARYGDNLVFDAEAISTRWATDFGRSGTFIPYGGSTPSPLPPLAQFEGRTYVLVVARFVPENTVAEFLSVAGRLSETWDVAIVGSSGYGGPLDDTAKMLSSQNDRIHWFGHVSNDQQLFSLWQNAAAYFHGHSVGGTNPALVQAMACGAPIVARNTIYNREVLGDNAIFVQPSPNTIYQGIAQVASDATLQAKLREGAVKRAQKNYSWSGVLADYSTLLATVVAGK